MKANTNLGPAEREKISALLDFEPAPVRSRRDGWTPERQRLYVAALAETGLGRAAAERVGMTEQSACRLRRRPDAAAFTAACAAAWSLARRRWAAARLAGLSAGARKVQEFQTPGEPVLEKLMNLRPGSPPPAHGPALTRRRCGDREAQPIGRGESAMLNDHDSSAIVAVSDLARARAFYGGVLGLELAEEGGEEGVLVYRTGATKLVVYQSEHAGTNRSNAVVWGVGDDLDSIVAALESKGAAFEHYPDIGRLEGNVHVAGGAKLVWLKDPDGNILHLNSM